MWRRLSSQIRIIRSLQRSNGVTASSSSPAIPRPAALLISRHISTETGNVFKKKVEDIMPIATGHELEELEAELMGRDILNINYPEGPFGTKASTKII